MGGGFQFLKGLGVGDAYIVNLCQWLLLDGGGYLVAEVSGISFSL